MDKKLYDVVKEAGDEVFKPMPKEDIKAIKSEAHAERDEMMKDPFWAFAWSMFHSYIDEETGESVKWEPFESWDDDSLWNQVSDTADSLRDTFVLKGKPLPPPDKGHKGDRWT